MGRGIDYSEDEDLVLTMAWIEISEDAIVGSEQKGDNFWERIKSKFLLIWKKRRGEDKAYKDRVSHRTAVALKNRWITRINHDCQKFESHYQKVAKLKQSGTTHEDWIAAAHKFFLEDSSWNDSKRPFIYLSSWEILKVHPKWSFGSVTVSSLKRKWRNTAVKDDQVEISAVDGGSDEETIVVADARPNKGRKAAKLEILRAAELERE